MADEPITREEQFLSAAAGNEVNLPTPITREEMYLAKAAGVNINITMLDPITRKERYLHALAEGGGGGSGVDVEPLTVTENGEYSEEGKAYSPVTVNVPNSYTAGDEGKVVSNGALVAQTAHAKVTQNGTIDTTLNNSVEVDVSGGGGLSYELVYEGEFTIQTTSTNYETYTTVNIPDEPYDGALYYFQVRDKAGKRDGYFFGSDSWAYGRSNSAIGGENIYALSYLNGGVMKYAGEYGVYASQLSPFTHTMEINTRYHSSRSRIIDGTYTVKVYRVDYIPDANPYA